MPKNTPNTNGRCLHCNNDFRYYLAPSHKDNPKRVQKYCSYECSTNRIFTNQRKPKPCELCGKVSYVFPSQFERRRYCSPKCRQKGNASKHFKTNPIIPHRCPVCSASFMRRSGNRPVYCSQSCAAIDRNRKKAKLWPAFQCTNCGTSFKRKPSRVKKYKQRFCSVKCHNDWQVKNNCRVTRACEICNRTFVRARYFVNVRKDARFCSRKCLDYYNSLNKRREKNVNWRGGQGAADYGPDWHWQNKQARKRDGNKCKLCGAKPKPWYLDVHHIIRFHDFGYIPGENDNYLKANRLSNLVILCKKCHRKVERKPHLLHWLMPDQSGSTSINIQRQFPASKSAYEPGNKPLVSCSIAA